MSPTEPAAQFIAARTAQWLDMIEEDSGHDRGGHGQVFAWLHEMPADLYQKIEPALVAQAANLSADAIMRSFSFASLFGAFGNHAVERQVLDRARSALPPGQRFQHIAGALVTLADGARLNADRKTRVKREGDGRAEPV